MPTLRSYVDGNGFYLKGYLHGVGFCVWQIGEKGLASLGVEASGATKTEWGRESEAISSSGT